MKLWNLSYCYRRRRGDWTWYASAYTYLMEWGLGLTVCILPGAQVTVTLHVAILELSTGAIRGFGAGDACHDAEVAGC